MIIWMTEVTNGNASIFHTFYDKNDAVSEIKNTLLPGERCQLYGFQCNFPPESLPDDPEKLELYREDASPGEPYLTDWDYSNLVEQYIDEEVTEL